MAKTCLQLMCACQEQLGDEHQAELVSVSVLQHLPKPFLCLLPTLLRWLRLPEMSETSSLLSSSVGSWPWFFLSLHPIIFTHTFQKALKVPFLFLPMLLNLNHILAYSLLNYNGILEEQIINFEPHQPMTHTTPLPWSSACDIHLAF